MKINNSKVLVIGGAGFIGSHVVSELLKTDIDQVVVYDNLTRGKKSNIEKSLEDPRCCLYPNDYVNLYGIFARINYFNSLRSASLHPKACEENP